MLDFRTLWGKHAVVLSWFPSETLPEQYKAVSTHGFCFVEDDVVLVNIETRGWDIPGGHVEAGETPEEAFRREVMEEASLSGDIKMLGYVLVDNREDEFFDPNKYPEIGCQVFYRMDVDGYHDFSQTHESSEREFFDVTDVSLMHHNWNDVMDCILEEATKK